MKRALFVGVNTYDDRAIRNLQYARQDAHSLCDLFKDVGYETRCLLDPRAGEVLAAVQESTTGLGAGDSFLFYFAGHGFTYGKWDLLFCRDSIYRLLRSGAAGIDFDTIRLLTEDDSGTAAFNRVFVLDACRSDFLTATRGTDSHARDLAPASTLVRAAPRPGSLAILRSCSAGQHALEVDAKQHGLFTCALLDVMKSAQREGTRLAFDESFGDAVAAKMTAIARGANLTATQTPDFAKSAGCAAHVLLEGRAAPPIQSVAASVVTEPSHFEPAAAGEVPRPTTGKIDVVAMFKMFAQAKLEREQVALLPEKVRAEFAKEIRDIEEDFAAAEDAKACAANDAAAALIARVLAKIKALKVKVEERRKKVEEEQRGVQLWAGGPYWAECNVGATRPEENGYYFWWGDTVGYKRNSSDNGWVSVKNGGAFSFDESSCPTCDKDGFQLKSGGYLDSSGNLAAKYDAATAHWGAPWRLPTAAEFKALEKYCDTEWTMRNGVAGRLVRGRGDYSARSIFLPAAGYGYGYGLFDLGSYGCCWSSVPFLDLFYFACFLNFDSSGSRLFIFHRYHGRSVRPVRGFAQ